MFKNSSELLGAALYEVQKAIDNNSLEAKIIIKKSFSGDLNEISKIGEELEIRTITKLLREEFSKYEIKSSLCKEFCGNVMFGKGPCHMSYRLVWELTLKAK